MWQVISVTSDKYNKRYVWQVICVVKIQSCEEDQYQWVFVSESIHSSIQLVKNIFRVNLSRRVDFPVFPRSLILLVPQFFQDVEFVSFLQISASWILLASADFLPQVLFLGLPLSALWRNGFGPLWPEIKSIYYLNTSFWQLWLFFLISK